VFPAEVEQVTVDAVVLDKKGEPVTGLTREDFTILDEGKPQALVSFDVVRGAAAAAAAGAAPAEPSIRSPIATNMVRPAERGRQFVVVFDDLHMSPLNARRAKAATAAFLEKGTQDGDRVLLIATGGSAWWSATLPGGRGALITVLSHLDGRRVQDNASERMTDFESLQIAVYRDASVAARVQDRFERYGTESRQSMQQSQQNQQANSVPGVIDPYVEMRAYESYLKVRARMDVTLDVLERCFEALADSRDRKSVLLVSEGFVYDSTNDHWKRVIEKARRAGAAMYFVDTRGLETLSSAYSAEFGNALDERDLMSAIADVSMEGEGSADLASDTGGFSVRRTNDFAAGAVQIGRESRSYYLLGFTPGDIPRDGRFHKIEVRVRGKGLVVRARKGYYAPSDGTSTRAADKGPPRGEFKDPDLQRVLDAPGAAEGVPLRMTAYALQSSTPETAQVVIAADVDVSRITFPEGGGNAVLDTLIAVAHREDGGVNRADRRVELQRRASAPAPGQPAWYSFLREFALPAGGYQAKLVVRDALAKRIGSVILEFEVPPLDKLRVSTPILTDTLQAGADGAPTPALLARRDFPAGGQLYCRFDVFGAARGPGGMPVVKASHALRRDGVLLGQTPLRAIQPTSIGALSRLIQIPLAGTAPGAYELVLNIKDEISGQTRELVEPFAVTAAATAAAAR
jgi:VWFA-related protein